MRALALIREQEVKSKSLINLQPEGFEKDWHTALLYMEKALKRTTSTSQDGFGAFAQRWLPYSTMMPVLAALLYRIDRDKVDNRACRGVKKWYWGSVFLERYAGAVESITLADYRDLVQWFSDPGHKPAVFERACTAQPLRSHRCYMAVYGALGALKALRPDFLVKPVR